MAWVEVSRCASLAELLKVAQDNGALPEDVSIDVSSHREVNSYGEEYQEIVVGLYLPDKKKK